MTIHIITPCLRPFNLTKIKESIPKECNWIIVYDNTVKHPDPVEGATTLVSPYTGAAGNPNRNVALEYLKDIIKPDDWVHILDDDNILHPDWYENVKEYLNDNGIDMLSWHQVFGENYDCSKHIDSGYRSYAPAIPKEGNIDTAQYMVKWKSVEHLRYESIYEADGIYAREAFNPSTYVIINKPLCYYNYLRGNKTFNSQRQTFCLNVMFKNEANNILPMLESVAPYIDFWIFQNNGSTDGTDKIVEEFFQRNPIPGFMYTVEEGWVGYGWNRDHLLQKTLAFDHGCRWIFKIDADETLVVEDTPEKPFNWSVFAEPHVQSFHIACDAPGLVYYRAWMWRASLPWRFNHDPAHETISLDDGIHGENFIRTDLPFEFRMVAGQRQGESYSVQTKYISDALKLEERLLREGTMLSDLYHMWYIAKSYEDTYRGDFFPLKEVHQNEYARRCIFYFTEVINAKHNYKATGVPAGIDEMAYYAMCSIGQAHRFLKEYEEAVIAYHNAEAFCPKRNDHLIYLAETAQEKGEFHKMLHYTTILMQPERVFPFPHYYFLIAKHMYHDTGTYVQQLHQIAMDMCHKLPPESVMTVNTKAIRKNRIHVVDNFYENPNLIREIALASEFVSDNNWYKGHRSKERHITPYIKKAFEDILGFKITEWESHAMNGRFQYCTPEDLLVYHYDSQSWAGLVYLTPNAPLQTGTSLYAHRETKIRHMDEPGSDKCFEGGFYDKSKFELVDTVGNVFNRLVLFDARSFHAATEYFGTNKYDSRLFHLFFFD